VVAGSLFDPGLSAIGLARAMKPPRGPGPQSTVIDTWQTETLSDQAKVLESVIECLPHGVIVADRSGRFLIFQQRRRADPRGPLRSGVRLSLR
jgi:hypothetical protein